MGLSNVNITINRNGLGQVAIQGDGAAGIYLQGVAVADKLELETPYVVTSIEDANAIGITADGANMSAFKQINEFYQTAGDGKKLFLIVSDKGAKNEVLKSCVEKLLNHVGGEISLLGICLPVTAGAEIQGGLSKEVFEAQTTLQLLADAYVNKIMPFTAVIAGVGFKGSAQELADLKTMSNYRTQIALTATDDSGVAAVGQLLGAYMAQPVYRKISRVKNGALPMTMGGAYLTDKKTIDGRADLLDELTDKCYIVYRDFPGRTGYFYNGDYTATLETDDLRYIARIRVIDKALKIAYNTYVGELDDEIDITEDGKLDPAQVSYLQELIYNQVMGNMKEAISNFTATIDPAQNVLSGKGTDVVLSITPKGYLNPINVTLGFVNPANS